MDNLAEFIALYEGYRKDRDGQWIWPAKRLWSEYHCIHGKYIGFGGAFSYRCTGCNAGA